MKPAVAASCLALIALLPGCVAPTRVSQATRAKADQLPPHPRGWVLAGPPADTSFYPLRCWNDGPATRCAREAGAQ